MGSDKLREAMVRFDMGFICGMFRKEEANLTWSALGERTPKSEFIPRFPESVFQYEPRGRSLGTLPVCDLSAEWSFTAMVLFALTVMSYRRGGKPMAGVLRAERKRTVLGTRNANGSICFISIINGFEASAVFLSKFFYKL